MSDSSIKTTLHVTDEEAKDFLLFQHHHEKILLLADNGVLDLRNGKAELTFNEVGHLMNIVKTEKIYQRLNKLK